MSYEGGYQPQQRPYAGPAAQRPAPATGAYQQPPPQRYDGPPQEQQPPPQPQYDDYQDDYGYGYYDDGGGGGGGGGYGPDYGGQYQDRGYDRGPPPEQRYQAQQNHYGPGPNGGGRGGRPPMGGGRGGPGPMPRAGTADGIRAGPYPPPRGAGGGLPSGPGRGYLNGPPPGRGGRPVQFERAPHSDPAPNHGRPPPNDGMRSPGDGGFGGNPFPPFPGQQRAAEVEDERQMVDRMAGMDISQRPLPLMGRGGGGPQRGGMRSPEGEYGRPSMDGFRGPPRGPPQGYDPRRGPMPGPVGPVHGLPRPSDYGQEYDNGAYGPGPQGPPRDDFSPPPRSMTMPMNDPMQRRGPMNAPQRMDSMPYAMPPSRGMPPRPSTSQGNRPPPQRMYPPSQERQPPLPSGYGGPEYDNRPLEEQPQRTRASFDAAYDSYSAPPGPRDMPNFDSGASQRSRASLDLHMGSGLPAGPSPSAGAPHGANRGPDMIRTKSQPDLRKQGGAGAVAGAVAGAYEMAADVPPMPQNGFQPGFSPSPYGHGHGPGPEPGPAGQANVGRRPSGAGLPNNPATMKAGGGMPRGPSPPSNNPDALPSHPTPVRPGLMADSMVSLSGGKPPPVRTYTSPSPGSAPSGSGGSGGPPSSSAPTPQPQQTPVTADELERLRVIVKADPNDQEMALRLARRLVEASDVLVPNVADPKTRSRARDRYLIDAHKILKKLASAQNMEAMFFMADSLGRGLFGHEPDNKEAFTLYQSAAKLGHAGAAYRTAVCCEIGHEEGGGTRKDPLKAIQWYKRAATLGDTPAMYKMGMIQLKGLLGQPKNPREAVGWLKRAAERADSENPHALHELGLLYESAQPNDAIVRDEQYAFTLFRKAAELGYKFSQFRLGCAYEYGLMGCPVDPRLSIMWYSKAATQEEHQSELALSGWYLTGSDAVLGQSDTEAYLWARKAAMAGLAKAEYAMGYFTEVGIGVPANMEDAKRWYWRAAAQDFPKARERLEDLKRSGKSGPRQRERISRSKIGRQQEGECVVM